MPDFGEASEQRRDARPHYDQEAISRDLVATATRWVPDIFINGRIGDDQSEWRVADITGRAPKKSGSCVIKLTGEHAGSWRDFGDGDGAKGGPISTVKKHFNLPDGQVFSKCVEILNGLGYSGSYLCAETPRAHGSVTERKSDKERRERHEIYQVTEQLRPLPGSLGEVYWNERLLGPLPQAAYGDDPDLAFAPDCIHFKMSKGFPTIVARLRYPWNFERTGGIHKIHLQADGKWHIGRQFPDHPAKLTRGPFDWSVVMLGQVGEAGVLAIGEGIETTSLGMAAYGVPGWATLSNGGMDRLAELIEQRRFPLTLRRLLVFADRGPAGERSASHLASAAAAAGFPVEYYLPRGDDDLVADRAAGLPPPEPITAPPLPAELPLLLPPLTFAALEAALAAIDKSSSTKAVGDVVRGIAVVPLDALTSDRMIAALAKQSGYPKLLIQKQVKGCGKELTLSSAGYTSKLVTGDNGEPKGIMSNVVIVLREADELRGSIGFNEFTGDLWVLRKFPWEQGYGNPCDRSWTDDDELGLLQWIQAVAGIHAKRHDVFDAVRRVASENKFHPVRDYLSSLVWDGIERIPSAAVTYFGAVGTRYHCEIFSRFLFSAVARISQPGIKADCMLILEGPQGVGKSKMLRILFDPWFTDQLSEVGSKDSSLELRGIWCAEYAELEAMTKVGALKIKSFMSRQSDRFRPPYGHVPITVHRQGVFAGTTNESEYLKDATGGRRFWSMLCGLLRPDLLLNDRDQLWAEATHKFKLLNAKWWIDENDPELMQEAAEQAEVRFQQDTWEPSISKWLAENDGTTKIPWVPVDGVSCSVVTNLAIIESALGIIDKLHQTGPLQGRVGHIMLERLKWRKRRLTLFNMPRQWFYLKPRP